MLVSKSSFLPVILTLFLIEITYSASLPENLEETDIFPPPVRRYQSFASDETARKDTPPLARRRARSLLTPASFGQDGKPPLVRKSSLSPHTTPALAAAHDLIAQGREKFVLSSTPYKQRKTLFRVLRQAEEKIARLDAPLPQISGDETPSSLHKYILETIKKRRARSSEDSAESAPAASEIDRLREMLSRTNRKNLNSFAEVLFNDLFIPVFKASFDHLTRAECAKARRALAFEKEGMVALPPLVETTESTPQTPLPETSENPRSGTSTPLFGRAIPALKNLFEEDPL